MKKLLSKISKFFKRKQTIPVKATYWRQKFDWQGLPEIHIGLSASTGESADFLDGLRTIIETQQWKERPEQQDLVITGIVWDEKTRDFTIFTSWRKRFVN